MPAVAVDRLDVFFGSGEAAEHAVKAASFAIEKGEAFGLVGESGSGKSTVLRCLAGLNRDWSGRIAIGGEEMQQRRSRAFHKRVQMVFQDPYGSLHPRLTVNAQLMEPIRIHGLDDGNGRVIRALDAVSLGPSFRFRYPHQLSGGQRQRVAIARALILEPDLLLLDEPTSALDVSIQAEILNLLSDLRRERGLTYLLVSHDLAVVAHMCDRVAVMCAGEIVEELGRDALRRHEARHPYTRRLLLAELGYSRSAAEAMEEEPDGPRR
jgi:peptide/nickel transport system ATP-binding protein